MLSVMTESKTAESNETESHPRMNYELSANSWMVHVTE